MKTILQYMAIGLAGSVSLCAFSARATLEIGASVQINARADFDAPLAAHGTWVAVGSYGRCWHPVGVAVEWRPYCNGRWLWTDCGWYWESDEPWAWACYHYGRWAFDSGVGWVWIPDIEWAPAWVYWRTGGGYIGWAPCSPVGVVIEPRFFAFVEFGRFHERVQPRTVIVNNATIINQTTVIKNIRHETRNIEGSSRQVVVNEGPGVEGIQKASGRRVSTVPIQEAARRTSAPSALKSKPGQAASHEKASPPPAIYEKAPGPATREIAPAPKEKAPATMPKEKTPSDGSVKPPAKKSTPHTPPSAAERIAPPGDGSYGGQVTPPGSHPSHPSAPPPTKPAEPESGNGGHGPQTDKDHNHGKGKL